MNEETLEDMEIWVKKVEALFKSPLLAKLKTLLAEADKPKLKHGDCGRNEICASIAIKGDDEKLRASQPGGTNSTGNPLGLPTEVFFNIFDLLAGEPLTEFETDVHLYEYRPTTRHAPILMAGNSHTIEEALEHWQKLGRLIFTAMKQGK